MELLPPEKMSVAVARGILDRGENPGANTTRMLVMTIDRLTGVSGWTAAPMECDVCGLPDPYNGDGDGIGSCECPRCECGAAADSQFCSCPDDY